MLAAADNYLQVGFSLTPLRGKVPFIAGWQTAPDLTLDQLKGILQRDPLTNFGLRTGRPFGDGQQLLTIDVDAAKDDDEIDGFDTLATLEDEFGELPTTFEVRTPSGGAHYVYAVPGDEVFRNTAGQVDSESCLGPKIDTRGHGGQSVLPPSTTEKGMYRATSAVMPTPLPAAWLERLREIERTRDSQKSRFARAETGDVVVGGLPVYTGPAMTPGQRRYLNAAMDGLYNDVATVTVGRNETVLQVGLRIGSFSTGAGLDAELAAAYIEQAVAANPSIEDYRANEMRRTLWNGIRRGAESPTPVHDVEADLNSWVSSFGGAA